MGRLNSLERKLATILAADVAGFSRLMGADEEDTLETLTAFREIIDGLITDHRGRVFGSAGDSVVAEFASPVEAVRCAIAFQDALAERNADRAEDRRMRFRVGVNLGDVLVSGDNLLGDGVNVAARLEGLAEAGEICVSGTVQEQVKGRIEHGFQDLGKQTLKNIDHPVQVYRIMSGREDQEQTDSQSAPSPGGRRSARPSIAVLPFDNLGGDPEQEYFADGITEDLITELTRFQDLSVIARNTVFTYKGMPTNVQDVGRDLGVRYVLEGSVRKAGNRVRVTAQLIDGETGHHLWAERFDRTLEDVFEVQDEVTRRIVASLAGKVGERERKRARSGDRPAHPEAYDLVLQGRELWNKFNKDDNLKARALYEKAIQVDPEYSRAYASLAWTYLVEFENRWSESREESYAQALEFARKGVQVNPSAHSNHLTLGQVYLWNGNHTMAIEALRTGLRLNPNDLDAYTFLSRALAFNGQHDEAIENAQFAMDLTANVPDWYYWTMAIALTLGRRFQDAVDAVEQMKNPAFGSLRWLAVCQHNLGQDAAARKTMQTILTAHPDFSLGRHLETVPFKLDEDRQLYVDGLRAAGAPE